MTAGRRSLAERWSDTAADASRRNPLISMLRGVLPQDDLVISDPNDGSLIRYESLGGQVARQERERRETYERRAASDPWYEAPGGLLGRTVAGGATLGGSFAGSMADPANLISPGRTWLGRAVGGAGVNAAGDVIAQTGDIGAGIADEYDLNQTLLSGALGAGISLGTDAAGLTTRGVRDFVRDSLVNPVPDFSGRAMDSGSLAPQRPRAPQAPDVRPPYRARSQGPSLDDIISNEDAARQTGATLPDFSARADRSGPSAPVRSSPVAVTVDDLWSGLLNQESGSSQVDASGGLIRSSAGAFGAAQLMPDTARDVAERMGRPELADIAAQTTAEGRRVNEMLGRAYLQEQLDAFGDEALALAAYNAGPGRVREWLRTIGDPRVMGRQAWIDAIPFDETRGYVRNILGATGRGEGAYAPPPPPPERIFERLSGTGGESPATPRPERERLQDPFAPENLSPARPVPAPRDLTNDALELLRRGQPARVDTGPSLTAWLAQRGGLLDQGGELRNVGADLWHRQAPFRPRLVREGGQNIEAAAIAAQEAGFLPQRVGDQDTRATPQDLIDAIREELAGRPRYARADEEGQALAQLRDDLDEVLNHLGVDPRGLKTADLRARVDAYFRNDYDPSRFEESPFATLAMREGPLRPARPPLSPEARARLEARMTQSEPVRLADGIAQQTLIEGVTPISQAARDVASADAARAARRGSAPPPDGGLFDEGARAQPDLFDRPGGKLAALDFTPRARRGTGGPDFSARARPPETLAVDLSAYGSRVGAPQAARAAPSGRTPSGLRDAPRPGAVARKGEVKRRVARVADLARRLRKALGIPHRQGRVMRRAVGEYDIGSGVVRTRAVQELDVLAHEMTHALEYKRGLPSLLAALHRHAKALTRLAYPGAEPGVLRQEGFAEWGRWYLTHPDQARRVAPAFYDDFEAALAKDAPEVLAELQAIQTAYRELLESSSVDVAKAQVAFTGRKGPLGELMRSLEEDGLGSTALRLADDLYTALVDDLHPLSVAERRLQNLYAANQGKKLDLKMADSPYALARLLRDAYAAGHMDLMHGVTPYRGVDPDGPSLAQALEAAGLSVKGGKWEPDALVEFDAYLISRRMVHEWDRYGRGELERPPDRNSPEFHRQVIADSEAAHPQWAQAAGLLYGWQNNLWRKRYDAGLITRETFENGLAQHPDYVPLKRDMSDRTPGGKAGRPRGAMQFAGGVKAFRGSTRDVISPLSSMMREAYELNALIKRNDTIRALDDLAEAAGPGAGAIVERLPAKEAQAFEVDAVEAMRRAAQDAGLAERDVASAVAVADTLLEGDTKATMFRQVDVSPRPGEAIVFVWRNGKKQPLLLADDAFGQSMYQALTGMTRDLRNVVVDAMAGATQLLRYGVTLSPEFMSRNIVRDQVATWINSDVGFIPGYHTVKGLLSELRQDGDSVRYASAGGMRGGANVAATNNPFPRTDAEAQAQLQHLRAKGWRVRRFASWRGLAELTDLSETATRLGVFKAGFNKAKRRGLSDYEAVIDAAYASRDTLDFGRRGSRMVTASRIVTFLNAALQGLDKTTRVLTAGGNLRRVLAPFGKGAPQTASERRALSHAYKAWAKVAALGAFGLGLRMLYADDPEYQEISDTLRATHWVFKHDGRWVFVPKPFELATLSNIFERSYEAAALRDPTAMGRLLSDFSHTIAPPHEVPALAVPFQIARNRDHLGVPIVPDHLRGTVDPQLQFDAYTSDLGKLIGNALGVSPAVVDHAVTGFGGSLGRYLLQGSNIVGEQVTGRPVTASGPEDFFLSRGFVRRVSRGATSQVEFWDQVSRDGGEMERALGSFRQLAGDGRDAEAMAYLNGLDPATRGYVRARAFTQDGSEIVHPMVRAQESLSIIRDVRTAARAGELLSMDGSPVQMTPQERRAVDNALADLALVEMRNALVATGIRGWANREPMDRAAIIDRLTQASPRVVAELDLRMNGMNVPSEEAIERVWPTIRERWEAPMNEQEGAAALRLRRYRSGSLVERVDELRRAFAARRQQ